jgi:DnaA family protein
MVKFRDLKQLLLDFTQAPPPTFANFVPGGNAELAHRLQAAARGEYDDRILYLWGESGAGKTHLLKAFSLESGAPYVVADRYDARVGAPVLAIDDVERLSDDQQVALFNAFNERSFRLLVVGASASPRDVALRRDLATRLATGLTYLVCALTDDEKRDALAAHAKARGFALGEDVANYLLTHARRDMGSLISALDALDRYSLETGRAVTVPLLKAALA